MPNHVLITGGAGFIGSTLAEQLVSKGVKVTAIDNFDPFYEESVKRDNIKTLIQSPLFKLLELDICDEEALSKQVSDNYTCIVHIAAKAGVHASIKSPTECQRVNVMGTQNMLEVAKNLGIHQFVFASSSSVYGVNPNVPWKESDQELMPISPYASSKLSCEMLGHVYAHLYPIRFLALRFFTVYGPKQRPDLAIYKFAKKIVADKPIPMYGDGTSRRDYTYVSDIVDGIEAAMNYEGSDFEIINLGNHRTIALKEMIATIADVFDRKAIIEYWPEQAGDVPKTFACIDKAKDLLGYEPKVRFEDGIRKFKAWYDLKENVHYE